MSANGKCLSAWHANEGSLALASALSWLRPFSLGVHASAVSCQTHAYVIINTCYFVKYFDVQLRLGAMNLLPKSHKEFSSAEYWEKFFKKRGNKSFEWYGEYPQLCSLLHKYIKCSEKILVIGCGNSSLSADMYDVGYHNIVNVDISDVVIRQMTEKHAKDRPKMTFAKMDILKMSEFADGEFSVILDKGTLDAMATDESEDTQAKVSQMFSEIVRVLRVGGRYVCVSLAQGHILAAVLRYFTKESWMVRVCRVLEEREDDHELQLPVFIFVLTKFKKMPNIQSILEVSQFDEKVERYKTIEEVMGVVGEIQQYALVRQQLNKGKVTGENISFDLYSAESSTPRYTLHIVDSNKRLGNKFAIFIVPEGREIEWLFSTKDGREDLCHSAGFERLVVVTLHRGHCYGNLDNVKEELSGKVMELAPSGIGSKQVPFLSVGEDIHCRTVRHQGTSELSGDYDIEDIESDGSVYRRLVFLDTKTVVQTEAKLLQEWTRKKGKRKKGKLSVDPYYLSWSYSSVMLAGLAFMDDCRHLLETETKLLLVGLGGGILPMFIHNHFPQVGLVGLGGGILPMFIHNHFPQVGLVGLGGGILPMFIHNHFPQVGLVGLGGGILPVFTHNHFPQVGLVGLGGGILPMFIHNHFPRVGLVGLGGGILPVFTHNHFPQVGLVGLGGGILPMFIHNHFPQVDLVGLGGGILPMFIHNHFPQVDLVGLGGGILPVFTHNHFPQVGLVGLGGGILPMFIHNHFPQVGLVGLGGGILPMFIHNHFPQVGLVGLGGGILPVFTHNHFPQVGLVGLGGGILPMFIHNHFPQIYTEVVEIDPVIASLATEWFGFVQDERITLHIADGVDHIKKLAKDGAQKHVIMLDADSKDNSLGMSGPPQAFLERDFLEAINNILDAKGVLILNLICRDQTLRSDTLKKIQAVFHQVYSCKLQDDVNEVLFALSNGQTRRPCVSTDDVSCADSQSLDSSLAAVQDIMQNTMTSSALSKTTDVLDLTVKLAGLAMLSRDIHDPERCREKVSGRHILFCTDVTSHNVDRGTESVAVNMEDDSRQGDDVVWFERRKCSTHITGLGNKAGSMLGFLRRNLRNCLQECRRLVYTAFVRSTLEYGAVVWDPYLRQDTEKLERIHRQAARFIT
ncbi:eEF1A lysine and N-terminal methyltransferase [Lamellibrachia satsuma]|nr:eEF1A lysine and N-terminal methyltransferase [Lamellibrachia satsuma]